MSAETTTPDPAARVAPPHAVDCKIIPTSLVVATFEGTSQQMFPSFRVDASAGVGRELVECAMETGNPTRIAIALTDLWRTMGNARGELWPALWIPTRGIGTSTFSMPTPAATQSPAASGRRGLGPAPRPAASARAAAVVRPRGLTRSLTASEVQRIEARARRAAIRAMGAAPLATAQRRGMGADAAPIAKGGGTALDAIVGLTTAALLSAAEHEDQETGDVNGRRGLIDWFAGTDNQGTVSRMMTITAPLALRTFELVEQTVARTFLAQTVDAYVAIVNALHVAAPSAAHPVRIVCTGSSRGAAQAIVLAAMLARFLPDDLVWRRATDGTLRGLHTPANAMDVARRSIYARLLGCSRTAVIARCSDPLAYDCERAARDLAVLDASNVRIACAAFEPVLQSQSVSEPLGLAMRNYVSALALASHKAAHPAPPAPARHVTFLCMQALAHHEQATFLFPLFRLPALPGMLTTASVPNAQLVCPDTSGAVQTRWFAGYHSTVLGTQLVRETLARTSLATRAEDSPPTVAGQEAVVLEQMLGIHRVLQAFPYAWAWSTLTAWLSETSVAVPEADVWCAVLLEPTALAVLQRAPTAAPLGTLAALRDAFAQPGVAHAAMQAEIDAASALSKSGDILAQWRNTLDSATSAIASHIPFWGNGDTSTARAITAPRGARAPGSVRRAPVRRGATAPHVTAGARAAARAAAPPRVARAADYENGDTQDVSLRLVLAQSVH